jgi:hypothetical protein
MTRWTIEYWDPALHRYIVGYDTRDEHYALKMFQKPYVQHLTRRLVRTRVEIVQRATGKRGR